MTNGGYLSKESILAADDLGYQDVSVPEWGGVVRLKEMTAGDRETLSLLYQKRDRAIENGDEQPPSIQAIFLSMTVVDADGKRIFSEKDIELLGRKSPRAITRVFDAATKLSVLRPEDVQDQIKNSDPSTNAASPSA